MLLGRDIFPDTVNFIDEIYESDPEHCRMIASPLTGAVYKRDNNEVQKLLKYLAQGTEAWKRTDKFCGGCQAMQ